MGRAFGAVMNSARAGHVHVLQAFRYQNFDGFADELGSGVAEELLGLCVDELDDARLADDDGRVGGRLEELAEEARLLLSVRHAGTSRRRSRRARRPPPRSCRHAPRRRACRT